MQLNHKIHRMSQLATEVADEVYTKHEVALTARQAAVLAAICANPGISQTGIVEKTGIDRSTLADVVRRLLVRGLVKRKRTKEDQRAYAVTASEGGEAMNKRASSCGPEIEKLLRKRLRNIDAVEFTPVAEAAE